MKTVILTILITICNIFTVASSKNSDLARYESYNYLHMNPTC